MRVFLSSSSYASGILSLKVSMGSGVLIPATTSSPWALMRYSPYSLFSPVEASRVKSTPVAEVSPMLPYAMACTFTAVPLRPLIF